MKKNRNAFFSENASNFSAYNQMMPNMQMMPNQYQMNANSSFYAGNMMGNAQQDYEERLAKIERQINRLDKRVSTIENSFTKSTDDFESQSGNMYMI